MLRLEQARVTSGSASLKWLNLALWLASTVDYIYTTDKYIKFEN